MYSSVCIHVQVEIFKKQKKSNNLGLKKLDEQIEKQVAHADKYAQSGTHTSNIHMYTPTHSYAHTMCHGSTFSLESRFIRHTTDGLSVSCPTKITVTVTQS